MPRAQREAPKMLGRYHLFEVLEEDALGEQFLARLEGPGSFQRWAVVRQMHAALEGDAEMVNAFYEAARVSGNVQHPNVAVTYDVGVRAGPSWVAREYIHGETASDLLERVIDGNTKVPWDLACRIVADVAHGVEALHEARPPPPVAVGFLRGGVTPGRAVVTYGGKAKVVEGCVPLVGGQPTIDAEALAYRAPEQSEHASADIRGEVFALGTLLWELCAGRRFYDEDETRAAVDGKPVPSLRALIRCPARIDDIVRRAAAPDPEVRQASCRVLARELEACLVSQGLQVSDDDVGKYMLGVFADRFEEREARLVSTASVTEVFDRQRLGSSSFGDEDEPSTLHAPHGLASISDTETPEVTYALRRSADAFTEPATARAPAPRPAAGDGRSSEGASPFLLATPPVGSVALPLVRKQIHEPAPVTRGFDDQPTTRWDSPLDAAPSTDRRMDADFFEDEEDDDELTQAYEAIPGIGSPSVDVNVDEYDAVLSTRRVVEAEEPGSAEVFELTRMGEPPVAPPNARGFPTMPMRAPSLSAVLRAHERPAAKQPVHPVVFIAIGAAAVLLIFGYLRLRATRAAADEATVFNDTPAPSSSVAATRSATDPGASPWVPVSPPAPRVAAGAPEAGVADPLAPVTAPPVAPLPVPPPVATAPPRNVPTVPTVKTEPLRHVATTRPAAPPPPPAVTSGKTGLLTVLCTPACDDVRDGGRSLGPSPVFKLAVSAGSHKITMRTTDPRVERVATVVVNEGETSVVRRSMEPGPGDN